MCARSGRTARRFWANSAMQRARSPRWSRPELPFRLPDRRRMISVYHLKPRFQALLRPMASSLAAIGVTANQVTIAAAAGSLAVGGLVASSGNRTAFLLIAVWLLIRMALNALDGMLAREFGQKSPLGAYLNELGDVVSDAT